MAKISRKKVWKVALQAKVDNGWCDTGFNEVMSTLGFPAVETVNIPMAYDVPEGTPPPTPENGEGCDYLGCRVCYTNPYPDEWRIPSRRFIRIVDTGEICWEAGNE